MNHRIEILTRDGAALSFECAPQQDVLAAAAAAQLTLPSQCKRGSCGACHASVAEGDYTLGEHAADALPAGDPRAVLLCRTTPRSDLRIVAPYDSAKVLRQPVAVRRARVVSLDTLTEDTRRLELQLDADDLNGSAAEFEAGQFVELALPDDEGAGDLRRPFSLANTSNWDGRLELLIRLRPGGAFSDWLRERARVGDALTVHGPQGGFGLFADSLRPRWFVAGGTGLAPVLSMLRRMAEYQEMNEARVFFGVNRVSDLFMADELARLQTALPQLRVEFCVREADDAWRGFHGTPVEALEAALASVSVNTSPDLYVCGPPAMVSAAQAAAVAARVPSSQFASERFAV
ncbi:2Fe-2S iron-sulfur cluster binding domain-containing protein [Paraburkholderia tropica]|uniref:NAD(P)H-flavin reductase n=1 Tax=Paraburkholderia tropica TaxID=92647 RepID=A0ABX5MX52_9BURK|nr:2Fe-2S iron-sulfur cluster binding domain-containing protein [Paraburkholderia tropica]MDE1142418.1 2Fe-2S iron-sulfur cluster binding domain-containing protein [Paraburkholderia tropica]PXX20559.1 NAD(P)H-flavin reductase [Paraburkholderia tropica]PZW89637.1 NAD(P)H-flavin reductase [Paraburkholderia tropica]